MVTDISYLSRTFRHGTKLEKRALIISAIKKSFKLVQYLVFDINTGKHILL